MSELPNATLVEVGELPSIDTTKLFSPVVGKASPIDNFMNHTNAINVIRMRSIGVPSPELASISVLGYLSAVETYFRTLLSRLAHIDPPTQKLLANKQVMFSVAMSRPKETLAEALYEDSFAQVKDVKNKLLEIGLRPSNELERAFKEYDKICHVRHCCVHRFGHLGTRNAEELGMREHRDLIGNVFTANAEDLDKIGDALQQFVKTCNNHVYRHVIDRTVIDQNLINTSFDWKWAWTFRADKKRFERYYDLFALTNFAPASKPLKEVYQAFHDTSKKTVAGMARRARPAPSIAHIEGSEPIPEDVTGHEKVSPLDAI
jgi:hypothetical protein